MTLVRVMAALVLGALVFGANDLNSCSFDPLHATFTPAPYPGGPDKEFVRGELGILLPGFRRAYLTVAYRYLAGLKLSPDIALASDPVPVDKGNPIEIWNAARGRAGLAPVPVNPYKEDSESHSFFLNCKDDAFITAGATLDRLIHANGPTSERVKQWAAAQDLVFQNCSAGPSIPQPLKASPDRAYQIAAAHFYSGQYDAARTDFSEIAKDASSPWRGLAPYLTARTMIRQGDLPGAEKQLQQILKDPAPGDAHERAEHLEAWLRIRLYPVARLSQTAQAVMLPNAPDFQQSLKDYTYLYDQLEHQPGSLEKVAEANDLTDWILDFQHSGAAEGHALERWRATHSTAWLIAALAAKPEDAAGRAELLKATDQVPRESRGYFTAQYDAAAMLEADGSPNPDDGAARVRLDQALNANPPRAARNLLLAARMRLARNWKDFLRDAQRQPVDLDGYDYSVPNGPTLHSTAEIGFDADAIYALNHFVPLSLEAGAALDTKLAPDVRRELTMAAWMKALLLKRFDIARRLNPVMAEMFPAIRADVALTGDPEFAAVWTMLHNPGVRPYPEAGFGRVMPVNRIDEFRDNWWCKIAKLQPDDPSGTLLQDRQLSSALLNLYGQQKPRGDFLSTQELATANQENSELGALPPAPEWLTAETLQFAKSHPEDPRVPEALHLAVRSTRYGCVSTNTAKFSKEAFELLHTRYAKSEWAKDTPYWFSN